jgi:ParB family chromosome partitioning protein
VLLHEDTALRDQDTGELVEEDTVDCDTEHRPEAAPAEGLRHAGTVIEATAFTPEYFCRDYRAAALTPDAGFMRHAGIVATADPDLQEARGNAEAEKAEQAKRERRKVLALNRLGEAAMFVRRDLVTKLLARPKGRRCSSPTAWPATANC